MNDQPIDERIEFSDDDLEDMRALGITAGEEPEFHPILMIWRAVLAPAAEEAKTRITPQWAIRITGSYRELSFADIPEFQARYFGKIQELLDILEAEIATDEECLTYSTPEEDVEHNSTHYKNVLRDWQVRFLKWELDWTPDDKFAAVEIAAIGECHTMFFGNPQRPGLTQQLGNIQLEYGEAEHAELEAAFAQFRSEYEAG